MIEPLYFDKNKYNISNILIDDDIIECDCCGRVLISTGNRKTLYIKNKKYVTMKFLCAKCKSKLRDAEQTNYIADGMNFTFFFNKSLVNFCLNKSFLIPGRYLYFRIVSPSFISPEIKVTAETSCDIRQKIVCYLLLKCNSFANRCCASEEFYNNKALFELMKL